MNERLLGLKDRVLSTKPTLCIERARIYTAVHRDHEELPIVRKRGLALRRTLEEMTIFIAEGELIVGNHASRSKAAPIFPEYAIAWIEKEIDTIDQRPAESYSISDGEKAELREICAYWRGRTLQEHCHALLSPELEAILDSGIVKAEGNMTSGDGHVAINLPKVLELGIGGYRRLVGDANAALDLTRQADLHKRQL